MSLAEHLTELRSRLLRCVLAVLALAVVGLVFARPIFGALMRPVLNALPPESRSLIYTSGIEEINVLMKVGLYAGIFLSTPVILWQLWGFISPGLYASERKLAGPFVLLGSAAFMTGALFCYFVMLPTMFQFLLQNEDAAEIEHRLDQAKTQEAEAVRFLSLGELSRAGEVAKEAGAELKATDATGSLRALDAQARLDALARVLDASDRALGDARRPVLRNVLERHVVAVGAYAKHDYDAVAKELDNAAAMLAGAADREGADVAQVWKLEKQIATANAELHAVAWTRPLLSMDEQLSLVLLLELAFGIIFEMPLVMAILSVIGIVKSGFLIKYQRHAFIVCLIVAAVITPTGDAVNLALMAGPMVLCYELGVLAVWMIERRRKKDAESTELTPSP